MSLSLQRRRVGDVNVITCSGKIVGGSEEDELQRLVEGLLPLEPHVILDVGGVTSVDSAGVGLLVRLLHRTRRAFADLKLCRVPPRVAEVLRITKLAGVFDVHAGRTTRSPRFTVRPNRRTRAPCSAVRAASTSRPMCSPTLGVLREAGYRATPCGNIADATVLLKVSRPRGWSSGPAPAPA